MRAKKRPSNNPAGRPLKAIIDRKKDLNITIAGYLVEGMNARFKDAPRGAKTKFIERCIGYGLDHFNE